MKSKTTSKLVEILLICVGIALLILAIVDNSVNNILWATFIPVTFSIMYIADKYAKKKSKGDFKHE